MAKKGSMKIPGKKLKEGKYVDEDIDFNTQNDDEVTGFGLPLSLEAAQKMIRDFQSDIFKDLQLAKAERNKEAIKANNERPIAITLGKESLLYILTQKDCEGIRFYFCKNHLNELSIVAVGVTNNPKATSSASLASKAKDLGSPDGKLTMLDSSITSPLAAERHFSFEVGPPTRLKDLDKTEFEPNPFEKELLKIFQSL